MMNDLMEEKRKKQKYFVAATSSHLGFRWGFSMYLIFLPEVK